MKKINLLWLFGLLVSMSLGFSACSDSDDDKNSVSSDLLSNTQMYVYAEENYMNGEEIKNNRFTPKYWSFYSDGTCSGFCNGTWEIKNNSIVVTTDDYGLKETLVYKIIQSDINEEKGRWELVLRKEYPDDEYDYQLYYMRFHSVIE